MSKSVRDQLLEKGLVKPASTPETRRAAARRAEPVEEKGLPPPFEAAARGVIVPSRHRPATARACCECGAPLPASHNFDERRRCAECSVGER